MYKLEELKKVMADLEKELNETAVFSENGSHNKSASARARKILNELKKSITSMKEDLMTLDRG